MNRLAPLLCAALPALLLACEPEPVSPPDDRGGGASDDPCALDSFTITKDTTLVAACSPYAPAGDVVVKNDATLTVEAGVELQMAEGARLIVGVEGDGRLIADGTADDPVRLVAASGSWAGITFGPRTLAGSSLEDVEIEDAGAEAEENSRETQGCVTQLARPGFVSVRRAVFTDCQQAGVSVPEANGFFASFEDNRFVDSELGVSAHVDVVAALGDGHAFEGTDENRLLGGIVDGGTVIPDLGVPWRVDGSLIVGGQDAPALVIDAGVTLRFAAGEALEVGTIGAGSLVARGDADAPIVLESEGAAGDWAGVVLGALTESAILEQLTLRDGGGAGAGVGGCLSVGTFDAGSVSVVDSTFERCEGAGVEAVNPGFAFGLFSGNAFTDVDFGVRVGPSAVASILDDNGFSIENRVTGGLIESSTFWGAQPVAWVVEGDLEIGGAGAPSLTLGAGLELRFEAEAQLRAGGFAAGGLNVLGAASRPVVLASAAATPAAGDWVGVVLGAQATSGGVLDHLEIHHAGAALAADTLGCLSILQGGAASLTVTHTELDACGQAALAAPIPGFSFVRFDDNTLTSSSVGLRVAASAVPSLGEGNTYGGVSRNLVENAFVSSTATWGLQAVPWEVDGDLQIGGGATLTLAPGTTLRFAPDAELRVGGAGAGGLIAEGFGADRVTFEAVPDGGAGTWVGIVFDGAPVAASIDRANIRDGGQRLRPEHNGAVSLSNTGGAVSITNTVFEDNALADIFVDCDSTPDLSGNTHTNVGVVNEQGCI